MLLRLILDSFEPRSSKRLLGVRNLCLHGATKDLSMLSHQISVVVGVKLMGFMVTSLVSSTYQSNRGNFELMYCTPQPITASPVVG